MNGPERCEDCGRQVSTPEDAKGYAGGEGEHLCWGGCEPASPAELRAEIERLRGERDAARGKAETFALALAVEAGRPVAPYLAALDWTTPEEEQPGAQASLDAAAHAQREGQYAAAYGGASLSEVAALEGIEEPT
jgi:hypothetical protein